MIRRLPFLLISALVLAACATTPASPGTASTGAAPAAVTASLEGDAARPAQGQGWVRSELYFGVGREDGPSERSQIDEIGEERWRAFLDREVTARFPDGLTVFDAYGQWLFRGADTPNRLRTKVLVVLHEDTPQRNADIEAIRLAWKRDTGHQSVLWSRQRVDVAF